MVFQISLWENPSRVMRIYSRVGEGSGHKQRSAAETVVAFLVICFRLFPFDLLASSAFRLRYTVVRCSFSFSYENMTTLDDKLLGLKSQNYVSSSESEGEDDDENVSDKEESRDDQIDMSSIAAPPDFRLEVPKASFNNRNLLYRIFNPLIAMNHLREVSMEKLSLRALSSQMRALSS